MTRSPRMKRHERLQYVSKTSVECSGSRGTPENETTLITDWDSNSYRQKSRAITNLENAFLEFKSRPRNQPFFPINIHRNTCASGPCVQYVWFLFDPSLSKWMQPAVFARTWNEGQVEVELARRSFQQHLGSIALAQARPESLKASARIRGSLNSPIGRSSRPSHS
jgi:hypothetical protein